jgi:Ser-tRNA(Ala) deacylase AlaX
MPCGGTHLKDIKEIGAFKILSREKKGRGRVRLYYTVE